LLIIQRYATYCRFSFIFYALFGFGGAVPVRVQEAGLFIQQAFKFLVSINLGGIFGFKRERLLVYVFLVGLI